MYEPKTHKVTYLPTEKKYLPDFVLHNGIIVEAKGRFTGTDRSKHLLIKKQHPDLDIRLVFMIDQPIVKGSKTLYSAWCDKHGFQYAIGDIPQEWIDE